MQPKGVALVPVNSAKVMEADMRRLASGASYAKACPPPSNAHRHAGGESPEGHLAEGNLGLVAIFGVQVMRQLNTLPHVPLVHELQLPVVRERMPVDYPLPNRILNSL